MFMRIKEFNEKTRNANKSQLKKLGFEQFNETDEYGNVLMLFPSNLYHSIPIGTKVVDVFFNEKRFSREIDDYDEKYKFLAYGFIVKDDGTPKKAVFYMNQPQNFKP